MPTASPRRSKQGQPREDARDGPPGGRDELIDGSPAVDELPAKPLGRLADPREGRGDVGRDARLGQPLGQAEVLDQLRDPRHDPGAARELAQIGEAAGRGRRIDGARDHEAFATLLECP